MEKICRSNMRKLWKSSALKHCPKLGSWKRRSTGLINEITRVQNICLKRRTGLKCEIIERLSVSRVKCLNRYRRGLETCPKVKTFKNERSATTLFSSLFSDESERPVWLSAESKILASTFGRFRLYRLIIAFYIWIIRYCVIKIKKGLKVGRKGCSRSKMLKLKESKFLGLVEFKWQKNPAKRLFSLICPWFQVQNSYSVLLNLPIILYDDFHHYNLFYKMNW